MKHYFLPAAALLLCLLPVALCAQSPAETLEKAVTDYNALVTYVDGLNAKTVTDANLSDVKARMDKGIQMLDQVIREGNSDEIKTARYFRLNFQYQYSFILGMKGENRKALDVMKNIEKDFTAFSAGDFPLRYVFTGKNYVIKWENFGPTQAEFYTGFAEVHYNLGEFGEAVRLAHLGLTHPNTTPWFRYICANKILDAGAKNTTLLTDAEREEMALRSIKLYDGLSDEEKGTVAEYKYPRVIRGVNILLENGQKNAGAQIIARCAEAAHIAGRHEPKNTKILQLYELAYRNGHSGDKGFHQGAANYAQSTLVIDRQRSLYVGQAATDKMAAATAETDCDGLRTVAEMYRVWLKPNLQAEYAKKAVNCTAAQLRAAKKAEQAQRRANSGFNLFAGVHVLPLIASNAKRDYGGAVNFAFRRSALEFSYLQINRNKENIFDLWIREIDGAEQDNLSPWDGFKAHFQPKFMGNNGSYLGLLFGYAEKKFDAMTVKVTNELTNLSSDQVFQPSVRQYEFMVNLGVMPLAKGFGLDMYYGFGANYSQFDPGNELDREAYAIDNPLLENRKDSYFGFLMRLGITLGLNFGSGNTR